MLALRVSSKGQNPTFQDVPLVNPDPTLITLKVAACGLNFADTLLIRGTYQDTPPLPFTLGLEFAGVVTHVGAAIENIQPGQRVVCFNGQAGLAEYATVPADRCLKIADHLDFETAAGTCVTYGTAHIALAHRAQVKPGETVLITGAAGGTGLAAIEMAKALGATVWAVASGAEKQETAKAAGADHTFDAGNPRLIEDLKALGGADIVFDTVGGDQFDMGFRACKAGGRILVIGFAGGTVPNIPANIALVKNISILGVNWPGVRKLNPDLFYASLAKVLELVTVGKLKPKTAHRYPLADALQALDDLKARRTTGKVVITFP